MAKEILPQLQQAGVVTRGLLGVSVQEVTPEIASHFRLSQTAGALVAMVTPDGPADRAGIQSGDVIVLFNRQPVAKSHDLPRMVASTPVGKVVPIQVIRDGKPLDLSVRIGEMKGEEPAEADNPAQNQLGISVQNLPADSDRKTGPESGGGVRVSDVIPGSPAAEAGLRVGDIIREVNRKPVANVSEWVREIESSSNRESILLRIERNRASLFVTVKPK
jgi:serine protease Do